MKLSDIIATIARCECGTSSLWEERRAGLELKLLRETLDSLDRTLIPGQRGALVHDLLAEHLKEHSEEHLPECLLSEGSPVPENLDIS